MITSQYTLFDLKPALQTDPNYNVFFGYAYLASEGALYTAHVSQHIEDDVLTIRFLYFLGTITEEYLDEFRGESVRHEACIEDDLHQMGLQDLRQQRIEKGELIAFVPFDFDEEDEEDEDHFTMIDKETTHQIH